ncbi:MAG: hypothetical protein KDB07_07380 [Planctomycetes bacterium]|nr:hypothetical protein [Planctomycetota bacterium]
MSNYVAYASQSTPQLRPSLAAFIQMMRAWLKDYPELNRLLEGEEHTDRMILWATIDAVDDFNATPPLVGFTFDQIPVSILKYGVANVLMESLLFFSVRNSLAYSDGGTNVNIDKTPQLMQLRQLMSASYEDKKMRYKVAVNISRGYDSVPSEYFVISGFYGAW